jgi:structural maintenance of chromosome 3 (chondroitin sulfate proteoglycan 6)
VSFSLTKVDLQLEALMTKQNRSNQFKSQAERDKHLKKEIKDLNQTVETQKKQKIELESDVVSTKESLKRVAEEIAEARNSMQNRGTTMDDINKSISDLKRKRDQAMDSRK